jgi:hypothetical protein
MTLRTWARKSRRSLLAVVIAIPAATLAAFSIDWPGYIEATVPSPEMLQAGDTGTYKNATIQLTDHQVIDADSAEGRELGALASTQLVIVTVHVDGSKVTEDLVGCDFELVAPGPAGERHWGDQVAVSLPYGDDDYQTTCLMSDHTAFDYKQVFVVPQGAADDVSLRYLSSSLLPPVLQWDW